MLNLLIVPPPPREAAVWKHYRRETHYSQQKENSERGKGIISCTNIRPKKGFSSRDSRCRLFWTVYSPIHGPIHWAQIQAYAGNNQLCLEWLSTVECLICIQPVIESPLSTCTVCISWGWNLWLLLVVRLNMLLYSSLVTKPDSFLTLLFK